MRAIKGFITVGLLFLMVSCHQRPADQGQQYQDGEFSHDLTRVQLANISPINVHDYRQQIAWIQAVSPSLYKKNAAVYAAVEQWLTHSTLTTPLQDVGLQSYRLAGKDHWGNTHLTGYYTPVLKARRTPTNEFKYPLYGMPTHWQGRLPSREQIYQGALADRQLELAYTASLIDNFIMEVQGSGYIDFEDGSPLTFFAYKGKNGHGYQSIGRLLVEQGEIEKEKISMQAIKAWAQQQSEQAVLDLLHQNASFVFFTPLSAAPVKGAAGVPLVAKASVASDRRLIPSGSVLVVEVPILDSNGKFTGEREVRLMVALDVGGAIKGQHLDIYQGIGDEAGELAGFYNHYGRVWLLTAPDEAGDLSITAR